VGAEINVLSKLFGSDEGLDVHRPADETGSTWALSVESLGQYPRRRSRSVNGRRKRWRSHVLGNPPEDALLLVQLEILW